MYNFSTKVKNPFNIKLSLNEDELYSKVILNTHTFNTSFNEFHNQKYHSLK